MLPRKTWKWVLHVSLICFFKRGGNNLPNYIVQQPYFPVREKSSGLEFMTPKRLLSSTWSFFMENRVGKMSVLLHLPPAWIIFARKSSWIVFCCSPRSANCCFIARQVKLCTPILLQGHHFWRQRHTKIRLQILEIPFPPTVSLMHEAQLQSLHSPLKWALSTP